MSNAISRRDFLKVTGAVGAAGLLAACGGNGSSTAASTATSVAAPAEGDVSLTISWWGGDTRHTAYQEAIAAFSEEHTNITVSPTFAAWSGWEDTMSTKFAGGVAEDVCQVNWNWLYNYSSNGQTFIDLNTVSDYIDLTQWDEAPLNACVVAGMQQAVPVSMTGRIFFWNMTTFNKAGITEVPKTLDDLYAAGEAFQTKLGEDYYPLHLGGYDRMILTVFYLESIYGKDWADPSTSTLNYTADEIAEGLDFIKSLVDKHVIMPLPTYYGNNGSTAANQSNEWITGKLAGIFEWDSAASKYRDALDTDNRDGFTVGEEIQFGDYKGGFTKVSMGLAITKTCQHPAEAAMLINFLLNEEAGASIMGSECGIPASKSGLAAAESAGAVDTLVEEANSKVLAFCSFQLDPLFEHNNLKADGTGIYQEVFDTIDYDGASGADVVDILLDGMESVGYTINA
ncbi:extracellular solute-binding protein [Faecalibacterium sp. An192]|uniref:ABC transporter substrate-binding protein n=1 Tax=Faecalibacterium sp. An192 TaxID=1965581 RepID=UPI000B395428|nr:extracellular solute-binding protein [Faecalibacterium sp. An192]OUP27407.1 sugar ABC transporter substrate-binding protein [Faecalibacterium sp. An192]